ncbi:hypothetical protein MB02_06010 [Croceicoccus estronivorus]|uniref:hypothetical protein n=1 Tax=Croceicoccus estronivorus TaxID=1172626 RepID=UPI00082A3BA7|nr:hypothetical protein [Croceicoccus estronivorus]OCC24991.1 hypothetical protein MB02_06010 [Croceicoccus estronivorus]
MNNDLKKPPLWNADTLSFRVCLSLAVIWVIAIAGYGFGSGYFMQQAREQVFNRLAAECMEHADAVLSF